MTAIDMQSSGVTPDDALAATVLAPVDWDALVCEFGRREAHYARDLAIRHGIGVEKIDALTRHHSMTGLLANLSARCTMSGTTQAVRTQPLCKPTTYTLGVSRLGSGPSTTIRSGS